MDKPPNSIALCQENVAFMRGALEQCCESHQCHGEDKRGFVPTRLLDLGPTTQDTPHLVITADCDEVGPKTKYATLSYCWGDDADAALQLKTTAATLQDRLDGTPVDIMSPVMRDAVDVCRALSIRYLWIDSLCIIQDQAGGQAADWNRESELMGKIFSHSHVTICAAASASCQQSFLSRSLHQVSIPFRSRINPKARGSFWLRNTNPQSGILLPPRAAEVYFSTWFRRGWVFQEQKLSRRLLLFGDNMVHFQCSSVVRSENGYEDGAEGTNESAFYSAVVERLRSNRDSALAGFSRFGIFREWMTSYASKSLKHETDRLPAVSGLAKLQFEDVRPEDVYMAGIWRSELPIALLWSVPVTLLRQSFEAMVSARQPANSLGAPSWSWACRAGFIGEGIGSLRPNMDHHLRAEYQDQWSDIVYTGLNSFGSVRSASLTLLTKCRSLPSDLCFSDSNHILGHWSIGAGPAYVAYCLLDGKTGLRGECATRPGSGLYMMLLSSSCDGDAHCDYSGSESDDEDCSVTDCSSPQKVEAAVDGPKSDHKGVQKDGPLRAEGARRSSQARNPRKKAWRPAAYKKTQESPSKSRRAEISPGSLDRDEPGGLSDGSETCARCNEKDHNRHAWGLLLVESEQAGKYIRVGIFTSRARGLGGTKFFADVQLSKIEIV